MGGVGMNEDAYLEDAYDQANGDYDMEFVGDDWADDLCEHDECEEQYTELVDGKYLCDFHL